MMRLNMRRAYKKVQKLIEYLLSVEEDEWVSFKEALGDCNSESWLSVMEEEMESF